MSVAKGKTKLSALLIAALMTANFVCADTYKNNVVDVRVNKEAGNAVKVTIYTDKPYTEPVVVNKKANNKYVILMPETKSALKAAPTVGSSDGTVSNVSVNTQDVSGGKGYTKIVITTDRAVTIVPRTQQLRPTAATASKPATTSTKPVTTTAKPADTSKTTAQKTAQQKAAEETPPPPEFNTVNEPQTPPPALNDFSQMPPPYQQPINPHFLPGMAPTGQVPMPPNYYGYNPMPNPYQYPPPPAEPAREEFNWTVASLVALIVLIMQLFYLILQMK